MDYLVNKDTSIDKALLNLISNRIANVDTSLILLKTRIHRIADEMDSLAPYVITDNQDYESYSVQFQAELKSEFPKLWLVFALGLILLLFGLICWYKKNQALQDKLLAKELNSTN